MEAIEFAARNVFDKLKKLARDPARAKFYFHTYVWSRVTGATPDVYVVSYPKCGRTWVRVQLEAYAKLAGISQEENADRAYVDMGPGTLLRFEHGQGNWVPAPPPLNSLKFNRERYGGKRVIFLVRDPRDVLVSSWYHLQHRERIYRHSLSEFIREPLVGIEKIVSFFNMWLRNKHETGDFLLVSYEEMHSDAEATFRRILDFLGLPIDEDALRQATAQSSFSSMKKMETQGAFSEPWMRPGAGMDESARKVRKGRVGSFREEMTQSDIELVDRVISEQLTPDLPYR